MNKMRLFLFLLVLSFSLKAQIPVNEPLLFEEGSLFKEIATPTVVPSGYGWVYSKSDSKLYFKSDAGIEYDLTLAGSVTSVSSGNFSPLFNVSITNSTTTPALSFTGISQTANTFFSAPSGSSGVPTFRTIVPLDIAAAPLTKLTKRYYASYIPATGTLEWYRLRKSDFDDIDENEIVFGSWDGSGEAQTYDNLTYDSDLTLGLFNSFIHFDNTATPTADWYIGFNNSLGTYSIARTYPIAEEDNDYIVRDFLSYVGFGGGVYVDVATNHSMISHINTPPLSDYLFSIAGATNFGEDGIMKEYGGGGVPVDLTVLMGDATASEYRFEELVGAGGITLSYSPGNGITIDGSGAGGGGSVTSVGLSITNLSGIGATTSITGSPVTGSGTITLNIPDAAIAVQRGLVTNGTQTFEGDKTFNNTADFNDDATFLDLAWFGTNKTKIDGNGRIYLYDNTTPAAGMLLKGDGTDFKTFAKGSANQQLRVNAGGTDLEWFTPAAGSVTSVSSGNFSPLFTVSVANSTTTPALSYTGISQLQNLVYASPNGSSGVPSFRSLAVADIGGLTPDLFLFGKSDGTIDQDPYGYYDKVNHYLRLGDPSGLAAVPGAELILTSGTHAAGITASSIGSSVTVSSGLGQTYMDGLYYRFVNLDGDAFAIGRAAYSTDEVLLFPAAKGTANKTLYVSSVVGDDVTLSWGDYTTGTVTSFSFTDGSGFDGTVSNGTTTPTLALTTSLTQYSIPIIGASGALTEDNLQFNTSTNRMFIADALDIGESTSLYDLHISDDSQVEGVLDAYNGQKGIWAIRSIGGTFASPTGTEVGLMGEFGVGGYNNGVGFTASSTAMVRMYNDEAGVFTSGNNGTRVEIFVTPVGSGTQGRHTTFASNGNLGIGDNTPAGMLTVGNGDLFQVGSDGDIDKIKNISYSFPTDDGDAGEQLQTDGSGNLTWESSGTYMLQFAGAQFNPSAANTYYFGGNPQSAGTTAGRNRIYILKSGTITSATIMFDNNGTLGTTETSTVSIRVNNTDDYTLSASVTNNARPTVFSNTSMSVPVTAGDYIEIKWATPASWSTTPTQIRPQGVLSIR